MAGGRLGSGEYHAWKRLTQLFGVSDKIVQRALAVDESGDEANAENPDAAWKCPGRYESAAYPQEIDG